MIIPREGESDILGGFWPASRRYEGRILEGLGLLLMAEVKGMSVR